MPYEQTLAEIQSVPPSRVHREESGEVWIADDLNDQRIRMSVTVSAEQRKAAELAIEYRKRFHEAYGINFGDSKPLSYHISVMEEALRTGVPVEIKGINPNLDIDV